LKSAEARCELWDENEFFDLDSRDGDGSAQLRQVIVVGAPDLLDESVDAKAFESNRVFTSTAAAHRRQTINKKRPSSTVFRFQRLITCCVPRARCPITPRAWVRVIYEHRLARMYIVKSRADPGGDHSISPATLGRVERAVGCSEQGFRAQVDRGDH
jgi:hypothetical protein